MITRYFCIFTWWCHACLSGGWLALGLAGWHDDVIIKIKKICWFVVINIEIIN